MRKVMLAVAGLLLLAAGGAIGWFAAKHAATSGEPAAWSGKPVFTYRAPDLLAPAPSWEEWKYPGSRVDNSSIGGSTRVGEIEFVNSDRVVLVSADEFDKVWAFYKEKCRLREPGDASSIHRSEVSGTDWAMTVRVFDDIQAHSLVGPASESVQARGFSVQTRRYSLVGFVYRPKDSGSTCILLVYRPNREFIGLLKDKLAKE